MKNQIKLFCIALAGAFMLTACGGPKLIGVTLPETPLVLATGETATAETSYTYDGETPENAQPEVVYTSSDEAIATVDENGVITGVAEGETTITATVGELSASRTVGVSLVFTHGHRAAHGHRHSANGHQVSDGRWEAPQSRFPCREAQSVHTRRNGRTGAPRGQSWRTKRKPPCWNTAAKNRDAAGKHSKSHFQFQNTTRDRCLSRGLTRFSEKGMSKFAEQ